MMASAGKRDGRQHVGADGDVLLDLLVFVGGQRSRLLEQPIGDAELADVVHQRGGVNRVDHPGVAQADFAGQRDGVALDALRVLVRGLVASRHRVRHRFDHDERTAAPHLLPRVERFGRLVGVSKQYDTRRH